MNWIFQIGRKSTNFPKITLKGNIELILSPIRLKILGFWIDGRMRSLLENLIAEVPLSSSTGGKQIAVAPRGGWTWVCHGIFHSLFLILPSVSFVLFLAFQARKSISKLSNGRSHIIIAYYAFLWVVSLLNLVWCSLQVCLSLSCLFLLLISQCIWFFWEFYQFVLV